MTEFDAFDRYPLPPDLERLATASGLGKEDLLALRQWLGLAKRRELEAWLTADPAVAARVLGRLGEPLFAQALLQNHDLFPEPGSESWANWFGESLTSLSTRLRQLSAYPDTLDLLRHYHQRLVVVCAMCLTAEEASTSYPAAMLDLLGLLVEAVWREFASQRGLHTERPVRVHARPLWTPGTWPESIAMLFVVDGSATPQARRHAGPFVSMLRRAIEEPMARGPLFARMDAAPLREPIQADQLAEAIWHALEPDQLAWIAEIEPVTGEPADPFVAQLRAIVRDRKMSHWPREAAPEFGERDDLLPDAALSARASSALQRWRRRAPALLAIFERHPNLAERAATGHLPTTADVRAGMARADSDDEVGSFLCQGLAVIGARLVEGDPTMELDLELVRLADALLQALARRHAPQLDLLVMGSYGTEIGPMMEPIDLLAMVDRSERLSRAEAQLQALCRAFDAVVAHVPEWGLRCDPQTLSIGPSHVKSYDAMRLHSISGLSTGEDYRLATARLLHGSEEAWALCRSIGYAYPLTPARLDALLVTKRLSDQERVSAKHARRHLRHGIGGISEIEWLVRLHELRYPTATGAIENIGLVDRLRRLGQARLLHTAEIDEVLASLTHLLTVRHRLFALGWTHDIVPENPDKLDRMAEELGFVDGNAFLAVHERTIERVRAIFSEGIERLRA